MNYDLLRVLIDSNYHRFIEIVTWCILYTNINIFVPSVYLLGHPISSTVFSNNVYIHLFDTYILIEMTTLNKRLKRDEITYSVCYYNITVAPKNTCELSEEIINPSHCQRRVNNFQATSYSFKNKRLCRKNPKEIVVEFVQKLIKR